jgi:hypothetical protein
LSLVVDAIVIAGGIFIGRWIARRVRGRRAKPASGGGGEGEQGPAVDPLAGFVCKLGDVVVRRAERDEAWLAGALVLEEERAVAVLFIAPEAGADRGVLVHAGGSALVWLTPLAPGEVAVAQEPPSAIEHDRQHFTRARRLPVKVARLGTGAPSAGDRAILAEYEGTGTDRLVVLAGSAAVLAWRGRALSEGEYEVLPGS